MYIYICIYIYIYIYKLPKKLLYPYLSIQIIKYAYPGM